VAEAGDNGESKSGCSAVLRYSGRRVTPKSENTPALNVIERFWKLLRRRATHNRLFDTLANPRCSVRNSLRYLQTMRGRVKRLIAAGCYARPDDRNVSVNS
jgi:hypothetical protein